MPTNCCATSWCGGLAPGVTGQVKPLHVCECWHILNMARWQARRDGFGAGDVKLLGAICGFAGWPGAVSVGLLSLVSGGALVLALSVRLSDCCGLANDFLAGGHSGFGGVSALWREKKGTKVPYGLAMTAGFFISLFV